MNTGKNFISFLLNVTVIFVILYTVILDFYILAGGFLSFCITLFLVESSSNIDSTKSVQQHQQLNSTKKNELSFKWQMFFSPSQISGKVNGTSIEVLDMMVHNVWQDFVYSWCAPLCADETVTQDARCLLLKLKNEAVRRACAVDPLKVVHSCLQLYTRHLQTYSAYSNSDMADRKLRRERFPAETRNNPYVLESSKREKEYFLNLTNKILVICLGAEYEVCSPGTEEIADVITSNVLTAVLDILCQPYWLHYLLITILSDESISVESIFSETNSSECNEIISSGAEIDSHIAELLTTANSSMFSVDQSDANRETHGLMFGDRHGDICDDSSSVSGISKPESVATLSQHTPDIIRSCRRSDGDVYQQEFGFLFESASTQWSDTDSIVSTEDGMDRRGSHGFPPNSTYALDDIDVAEDAREMADPSLQQPSKLIVEPVISDADSVVDSNEPYVVYTIEYLAWHPSNEGSWFLQRQAVKRRFREFVTLQEKLDEIIPLKALLKGIKAPSTWLNLPLGKHNQRKIEKRRLFLETYLQGMVGKPELCNSLPVKEFFAYDCNPNVAFVRRLSTMQQVDRMLVKTVSGMFETLSTILPQRADLELNAAQSQDDTSSDAMHDPHQLLLKLNLDRLQQQSANKRSVGSATYHIREMVRTLQEDEEETSSCCSLEREAGNQDMNEVIFRDVLSLALATLPDGDAWVQQRVAFNLAICLLAQPLGSFLTFHLTDLLSEPHWAVYLTALSELVWPDGQLNTEARAPPTDPLVLESVRNRARQSLCEFLPRFLPWLIGQETFDSSLDFIMKSIELPELNRDFAMDLLDLIISELFPELLSSCRDFN